MTEKFDFEQELADLKACKPITGKDSELGPLVKQLELYPIHRTGGIDK